MGWLEQIQNFLTNRNFAKNSKILKIPISKYPFCHRFLGQVRPAGGRTSVKTGTLHLYFSL